MWKKFFLIFLVIAVVLFLFFSFTSKKIKEVTNVNYNTITKIVFVDGSGKNKPLTIENKEKIQEFMSYINGYVVIKVGNPYSVGWIRSASFCKDDKEVMNITFVSPIIINGEYYRVIRGGLSQNKIDNFLKSINPSWV